MFKDWIKNISGNTEAVFLKLGTTNVHRKKNKMAKRTKWQKEQNGKKNKMTPLVLLP